LNGSVETRGDSGGVSSSGHVNDDLDGRVGSLEDISETDGEDVGVGGEGVGSDVGHVVDELVALDSHRILDEEGAGRSTERHSGEEEAEVDLIGHSRGNVLEVKDVCEDNVAAERAGSVGNVVTGSEVVEGQE
jgi:hypothetical protein